MTTPTSLEMEAVPQMLRRADFGDLLVTCGYRIWSEEALGQVVEVLLVLNRDEWDQAANDACVAAQEILRKALDGVWPYLRFLPVARELRTMHSPVAKPEFGHPCSQMPLADDRLVTARQLANGASEAEWRAAASSAYYSCFHLLVDASVRLCLTSLVPSDRYIRSVKHHDLVDVAKHFSANNNVGTQYGFTGSVSTDLVDLAKDLPVLYGWRINADYDIRNGFGKRVAEDAVRAAERIHTAASQLEASPTNTGYLAFLAAILVRKPLT